VTDLLDRLRSALADRYRIQRELGAGGMATVYLAFPCAEARARPPRVGARRSVLKDGSGQSPSGLVAKRRARVLTQGQRR
jgi:hypothetical protein